MSVTAREAALLTLGAFRKSGAWLDDGLDAVLRRNPMEPRDAALASRICYGTVQNLALCDFYISAIASRPIEKLTPAVADILRLSAYQLLFLSRVPARAVVDEAVKLTKKHANPGAAGLVNAVLRKMAAGPLPSLPETDRRAALALRYSHPQWLVDLLCSRLEETETEAFLLADNADVPVTLQTNTLRTDTETLCDALASEGVSAQPHPWLPNALTAERLGDPTRLAAFQRGDFYVQDAAARLAVHAAALQPDMFVVDACAAPGGKTFAAGLDMRGTGRILACDLHGKKLHRIRESAQRLGLANVETLEADARVRQETLIGSADAVLADVPCSGLGVIRKKPEIRFKDPESFRGLPQIQLDILRNLADYVRLDGVLLYSTCTVRQEENEDVVRAFLAERPDFAAEAFALPGPAGYAEDGMQTLWPHIHGTDGFFLCRLRKRKPI